jgi:[protein-PII] uridylyltransferase
VDAHCILAVESATKLQEESSPMGRRYRRLKDKGLLHLALLIHDIGKGYEEDHCIVGARIARDTAERLELDPASSEILEWLVLQHLMVPTIAFRHDLHDPQIVVSFAKEVGSVRRLELLIVHSVADLMAVGPEVLTDWKLNLIEDLYLRTRRYFETGDLPGENDPEWEKRRESVHRLLEQHNAPARCSVILDSVPLSLLRRRSEEALTAELIQIGSMLDEGRRAICTGQYDPRSSTTCYTVTCRQGPERVGTFARVTGALTICGLSILRSDVETVCDDLAWDDFWVDDPDYPDEPPASRIDEVCQRVCDLLTHRDEPLPPYRSTWANQRSREPTTVNVLPTQVVFDNETIGKYTIISFFAYDQVGLLHRIASAIAEQKLILHFAKIDTHLDQVADVFYVSELDGTKITSLQRQEQIRDVLLKVVD